MTARPYRLLALAAVLAVPALAQVPSIAVSSAPYAPLAAGTPLTLTQRLTSTAAEDEGFAIINLGFSFPFMGQSYTQVAVDTNGFVLLGGAGCTTNCRQPSSFPSTLVPQGLIGGFWDDLRKGSTSQLRMRAGPGEVTFEWFEFEALSSAASKVTQQVTLFASGMFTIHHGPLVGTTILSGAVGFENNTGQLGANLIAGCTTACGINQWVVDRLFTMGQPTQADLGFPVVTISNLAVQPGGNWTFDLQGTVRNYGLTQADTFLWRAFLSTDQVVDASDLLVAQGGPVSVPAASLLAVSGAADTAVPVPPGAYFVLMEADHTNVVTEGTETNNVGSSADQYVQGVDLVARSISGVTVTAGRNVDPMQVHFSNRGTVAPGPVAFRLYLSSDTTLDASDFEVQTLTRTVSGGETINQPIAFTMPANAPQGDFHYILQVDPLNAVAEAVETNNVVVSSGKVTVRRADLVAVAVDQVSPVTNASTRTGRFGEPVRIAVTISNTGAANAPGFHVAMILSTDANLSLLSDTWVCEQPVAGLNAGVLNQVATVTCPVPLTGADGSALPTGLYYLYAAVDSRNEVAETLESNNVAFVGPVRLFAPGADLAVTAVTVPPHAGAGEVLPVLRTLRNEGNVDALPASYRLYASANDIITPFDVPLGMVAGPGAPPVFQRTVTLAAGAQDTNTDLVLLPSTLPAGTWYIGCLVDPTAQVPDLDRANNGLASRVVQIAGSSLRVARTTLPDATVGQPYTFHLTVQGAEGPVAWSVAGQPAWLSLGASDGVLRGTPALGTPAGVSAFTVTVVNRELTATARLVLRTLAPGAQVEITTTTLPPVINSSSVPFSYALGAAGGVRPYTWRLVTGVLPGGMGVNAAGVVFGSPRGTPNGVSPFTVEVKDAAGGVAQRALSLRLVPPGALVITRLALPDALLGAPYLEDILVENADGSGLALPLTWRITGLPRGLSLGTQSALATISGQPTEGGLFPIRLTVEDETGRTDSIDYVLVVHAPRYTLKAALPEVLRPSSEVSVPFTATPASGPVTWRLAGGALPPGLTLTSAGLLGGTLTAEEGQWNFLVEARDGNGGSGLGAFALRVEAEALPGGCSAMPGLPLLLTAALVLAGRRRRPGR